MESHLHCLPSPASPCEAVIVLNGTPPPTALVRQLITPSSILIAADGGAAACLEAGVLPHHVVGDLDSLSAAHLKLLAAPPVTFHRHPREKDATDGELALLLAARLGATRLCLTGTRGGRTSQFLGNLGLLHLAHQMGIPATLREVGEETQLVVGPGSLDITGRPGNLLSLVPLCDCRGVSLAGVRWPLEDATLPAGTSLGISNELVAARVHLELTAGILVVVREWQEEF
ncbi:MAG: thiamine diphosphokinase [Limnochordales bacterium]|nr:thiamine diphosphokinase [Limnochordales bacterium]